MKKLTIVEIILLLFTIMVVYIFCVTVTSMALLKIPTTEANAPLRTALVHSLDTIIGLIFGVLGKGAYDNSKKVKDETT